MNSTSSVASSDVTPEAIAIAVAPKVPAILSIVGSSFICYGVLKDKSQIASTCNRLLLGMSISDVVVSTCFLFGTLPIPAGTEGVFWAVGNEATCEVQGFFSQFSITVAMYNACLSIFYLAKIRYNCTDLFIARKLEPFLHAFALLFGLITSSVAIGLKQYNNDWWECWISPLPPDCKQSYLNDGESTCIRWDNASLYRWVLYYGPLWTCILAVTVNMILVYLAVRAVDIRASQYSSGAFNRRSIVANQGLWYCGAFYATWIFPTITRLVQVIAGSAPYPLVLVTAMFVPLQGFFNAIVYIHPRYKSLRVDSKDSSGGSKPFRRRKNNTTSTGQSEQSDFKSSSQFLVAKNKELDPESNALERPPGLMSEEEIREVEEAVNRVLLESSISALEGEEEETHHADKAEILPPRIESQRAFESWQGMRETLKNALASESSSSSPSTPDHSGNAGADASPPPPPTT